MIKHYNLATTDPEIYEDFGFRKPNRLKGHWFWSDFDVFGNREYVFMAEINPEKGDVSTWSFDRKKPGPPPTVGMTGQWIIEKTDELEKRLREAGIIDDESRSPKSSRLWRLVQPVAGGISRLKF
jgi:hypothetical protein